MGPCGWPPGMTCPPSTRRMLAAGQQVNLCRAGIRASPMKSNWSFTFDFKFLQCPVQCRVFHAMIKAPLDTASPAAIAEMGVGRESAVEAVAFGRRVFFKDFLPPCTSWKQILRCQLQSQYVCFWMNVRVFASVCQPAHICMQTLNLSCKQKNKRIAAMKETTYSIQVPSPWEEFTDAVQHLCPFPPLGHNCVPFPPWDGSWRCSV